MAEKTKTNPLGMKTIQDMQEKGFLSVYGDTIKMAFTHDWCFAGWEKILVLTSILWLVYSVWKAVVGLF